MAALLFLSVPALAAESVLEKAFALSLRNEKVQARQLLLQALKKEKNPATIKELSGGLEQILNQFNSEKSQQAFETGMAVIFEDPNAALAKFNEVSELDKGNLQVEMTAIRVLIGQNECEKAASRMEPLIDVALFLDEPRLLAAQIAACRVRPTEFYKWKAVSEPKKSNFHFLWQSAEAELYERQKMYDRALSYARQSAESRPDFPEAAYWIYRSNLDAGKPSLKEGQKYLSLCKGLSIRKKRELLIEPSLCRRTTEVESSLKKLNNGEE